MQERKVYIDAVAGIMILWMVLGHLQQVTGLSLDYPNILFFFMPWFYYKAGALSKERTLREIANRGGAKIYQTVRCVWANRANNFGNMYAIGA